MGISLSRTETIDQQREGSATIIPDDFLFEGSVTEVRRQIGNAVPPEGVRLVAKRLLPLFTGEYEPVDLIPEYEKMKKMTVKERLEYVTSQMN